jgi:hypothetical protein
MVFFLAESEKFFREGFSDQKKDLLLLYCVHEDLFFLNGRKKGMEKKEAAAHDADDRFLSFEK